MPVRVRLHTRACAHALLGRSDRVGDTIIVLVALGLQWFEQPVTPLRNHLVAQSTERPVPPLTKHSVAQSTEHPVTQSREQSVVHLVWISHLRHSSQRALPVHSLHPQFVYNVHEFTMRGSYCLLERSLTDRSLTDSRPGPLRRPSTEC